MDESEAEQAVIRDARSELRHWLANAPDTPHYRVPLELLARTAGIPGDTKTIAVRLQVAERQGVTISQGMVSFPRKGQHAEAGFDYAAILAAIGTGYDGASLASA